MTFVIHLNEDGIQRFSIHQSQQSAVPTQSNNGIALLIDQTPLDALLYTLYF